MEDTKAETSAACKVKKDDQITAEQPVEAFIEETKLEKTIIESEESVHDQDANFFKIMTMNMNGKGIADARRDRIVATIGEVSASVIFCQELPGFIEKRVVEKCGNKDDYAFVNTGNKAAVMWRTADFDHTLVSGTDSSMNKITEKLKEKRSDVDVSEVLTRTAMVKLTSLRISDGTEASFLAVSWHGPSSVKADAKQKVFNGLLCFVLEVCEKEKVSSYIIGGDFNLNTLEVDLEQHKDITIPVYVLCSRDEENRKSQEEKKKPGHPFVLYKDNFVFSSWRSEDITVSHWQCVVCRVKPREFEDSEDPANDVVKEDHAELEDQRNKDRKKENILDHAPVVGVLQLKPLPDKKPLNQVNDLQGQTTVKTSQANIFRRRKREENAEDEEQSHASEKKTSENNRPDLTPENSDHLASRRNTEGRSNLARRLFSENDDAPNETELSSESSEGLASLSDEQPSCEVVYTWKFPENLSQSTIDGRKHSNACSVISIAVAHRFLTSNIQPPSGEDLPSDWVNLLRQCMEEGNTLYDGANLTPTHLYQTAEEAAALFNKPKPLVKVEDPLPLWLVNEHEPSTLGYHLQMLYEEDTPRAALYIYDNRTITFLPYPNHSILVTDSHLHSTFGAAIIFAKPFSPVFISCLKEITGMDDSTYGNFSHVQLNRNNTNLQGKSE